MQSEATAESRRSGRTGPKALFVGNLAKKGVEKRLFRKTEAPEIDRRVILFLSARCTVKIIALSARTVTAAVKRTKLSAVCTSFV